jgi:hypothetical protein
MSDPLAKSGPGGLTAPHPKVRPSKPVLHGLRNARFHSPRGSLAGPTTERKGGTGRRGERRIEQLCGIWQQSLAQGLGRNDGADRQAGSRRILSSFGPNARFCDPGECFCNRICSDRSSAVRQTRREEARNKSGNSSRSSTGSCRSGATFYSQIRVTEEVRKCFRGEDHMANAKRAQTNHWRSVPAHSTAAIRPPPTRSARRIPGSDSSTPSGHPRKRRPPPPCAPCRNQPP